MHAPIKRCALHVDAFVEVETLLSNHKYLTDLVYGVANIAGMIIINLHIADSDCIGIASSNDKEASIGISLVAVVPFGHITIHTWPALKFFMFDIVAPKHIDKNLIYDFIDVGLIVEQLVKSY